MTMTPQEVEAQANELADLFYTCSAAVDQYRQEADPPLAREQMARLKDEAQALDDRAHYFTAEAIGATLETIQPDLAQIQVTTGDALAQLKRLDDVSRVIVVATSVLSLGTAIAAGDPGTILAAAQALAKLVTPS